MIFSKTLLRKVGRGCRKNKLPRIASRRELVLPAHFLCPISLEMMKDPVMLPTGVTYDRENIEKWLWAGHSSCPVTNQALDTNDLVVVPNHAIRKAIQDWCVDNKSYGVERIPTPKVPLSPSEVSEICAWLEAAIGRRDNDECLRLLERIKGFAKESERDKKCVRDSRLSCALSAGFNAFASIPTSIIPSTNHADLLKELLSALTWTFRAREDIASTLGSKMSLLCMARVLKGDDPRARQNVVVVLKKLFSMDPGLAKVLIEADDEVPQTLMEMLKYPECPSAMKTLLVVMHHVVLSSTQEARGKLVRLGLVHFLLEIVIDAEKGKDEKALRILDVLCDSQEGREGIFDHSLIMPLLVKKILRISDVCSELCVSILWKLCKNGNNNNEKAIIEALELGAFQKLLIVLQVGCGETTKEKANEVLKLMNVYRVRVPCLHTSTGFKYMEKSY